MLPLGLQTPTEIAKEIASRVRAQRLLRGWTQRELAERAGLTLATYRRFERTGRIAFERLLRIAVLLDAQAGFERIFELPRARSLSELAERAEPGRKRGRRRADP